MALHLLSPSHVSSRNTHWPVRHVCQTAALALCGLVLSGCGPERHGSPKPPEAFGPLHSSWLGCPSLQGVYAFSPVGANDVRGNKPSNRRPEPAGLPFSVNGPELQIWIQQGRGETILRTRMVNRARNVRNSLTRQWSLATYGAAQTQCTSGMLDVKPQAASDGNVNGNGGTRSVPGFRLALLKDGALAVGTRTLSTGNKGSFFSWGGQSYGTYDAPDVETWSWSKLARTGPGDREPAVVDAYVPGATAP